MKIVEAPDAFRCEHIVRFPLADGNCSVSLGASSVTRLPGSVAAALDDLTRFHTLGEHAERIGSRLGTAAESVLPMLDALVRSGALFSRRELLSLARSSARAREAPPDLRVIGFVTRDRRGQLERAIESYLDNARVHHQECSVVVTDDSRSNDARALCRARLEVIAARRGVPIAYAGADEKERYAREIAREADVPLEVARFGLVGDGDDPAASRNCQLLHSVGEPVLFSLDHVHARFAAAPDDRGRLLALGSCDEHLRFFPSGDAMLSGVQQRETNVLALHATWLGRSLGDVVRAASIDDAIDADGLTPRLMRHLQTGAGRVVMTTPGLFGACAALGADWLVTLPKMARRAMLSSQAAYKLAMRTRDVLRVVPRVTLEHPASCSGSFALDNRVLVAPFTPIGDGEDSAFGVATRLTCPEHYLAKLPVATYHAAEGPGASTLAVDERTPTLDWLVAALVGTIPVSSSADPATRMRELGASLSAIGGLDDSAFEAVMRAACAPIEKAQAEELLALLGQAGTNAPWWTRDAVRVLRRIEQRLASGSYSIATDLLRGRTPEAARGELKRRVGALGALFASWPALVEAAAVLRARGVRVARPLQSGGRLERRLSRGDHTHRAGRSAD